MKKMVIISVSLVATAIFAFAHSGIESETLKNIQSGKYPLICNMSDGERVIAPEMVAGFDLDLGWKFENGGSKNCQVIK